MAPGPEFDNYGPNHHVCPHTLWYLHEIAVEERSLGQDEVGRDAAGDCLLDGHQLLLGLLDAKMQIFKVTPAQGMRGGRLKKGYWTHVQTCHSAKVSVHMLCPKSEYACMVQNLRSLMSSHCEEEVKAYLYVILKCILVLANFQAVPLILEL